MNDPIGTSASIASSTPTVTPPPEMPTQDALAALAARLGLPIAESDLAEWHTTVCGMLSAYESVSQLAQPPPLTPRMDDQDQQRDPWGAWRVRASIAGAPGGSLLGRKIAIKDSIAVAGLPLTNGCDALDEFYPTANAPAVQRALDQGAEVAGTAVCESFCLSGVSYTSSTGPVNNPYDLHRSAGGSSSGAAVLVATGQVDMAIGGDQGGSIRLPASACGIFGLKPTFDLVPYEGAIPVEPTLDHLGPMARTTADLALLLAALAGQDGEEGESLDSSFRTSLEEGVSGLTIGLLREGFGHPQSDPAVDDAVRRAVVAFRDLGATVRETSIPWHREAGAVHNVVLTEGGASLLWRDRGMPPGRPGPYIHGLGSALNAAFRTPERLPDGLVAMVLAGTWGREHGGGEWYAAARQLVPEIRRAYDKELATYDILALPTAVALPGLLPLPSSDRFSKLRLPRTGINTAPFNLTGHPAITVPCGQIGTMPVGMMLVAPHHKERTLLRAASAFERHVFACPPPPIRHV